MGKRTCEKSDEEIKRKIRRLEVELQLRQTPQQNGDQENENYYEYAKDDVLPEESPDNEPSGLQEPWLVNESSWEPPLHESSLEPSFEPEPTGSQVKSVVIQPNSTPDHVEEEMIPLEILEALGVPKRLEEKFGKKIPSEVSERLGKILIEGLAKDQKEALLTRSLFPENFQLAKAPKLNAEVSSVLVDPAKNRDKRLENLQNQLGCGIARLADLTTDLIINKQFNNLDIIKRLSEVNQILLDLHYEETMNRRRLIIPILDKSFIRMIENVKRVKFLFGENLGENIKNTKSLERSGLQIKKANLAQQINSSRKATGQHQGNFRQPSRQANAAGAARAPLAQPRYYPAPPPPPPPATRRQPPVQQRRPPAPPPPPGRASYRNTRR